MARSVHTPEYDAFRSLLIECREQAGVGVRELARRLAKPPSYVAKYESGMRRVDVIEFVTIAKALGASPEELFDKLLRSLSQRLNG